jgi:nicotinate-nucleotide adenylyltransferase
MQAGSEDRIEMLRLATEDEPAFEIDAREIERGGTSFTVDTARSIQSDHQDSKLFWILGGDQLELLPNWRSIEELASMLTFIVFKRPGFSLEKPSISGLQLVEVEAPLMEQSSSAIRERLAHKEATGDWLPASVGAFISAHQLYTR